MRPFLLRVAVRRSACGPELPDSRSPQARSWAALVVEGLSWQWIFWINVPIGLVLLPLATRLTESYGPDKALDIPGLGFASAGLLGLVWGLINGNGHGWTSPEIVAAISIGVALLAAFVVWERRAAEPMLPMRFFQNRAFSAANSASLLMYFGMFGSIFLLTQFFQTAQGYSPLQSGLRVLPWTAMPMIVAPIAGALSDRIGGRPLMATGLALQAIGLAWIASVSTATVGYASFVGPFIVSGIGMGLFFAPVANVVLSSVRPVEEGKASGANNAIREVGGVLGVAILASIFARTGGYESAQAFNDGLVPALWVGAIAVGVGAVLSLLIPRKRRAAEVPAFARDELVARARSGLSTTRSGSAPGIVRGRPDFAGAGTVAAWRPRTLPATGLRMP